ncbi:DUF1775 domain-containing protein [Rhizobium sp. RAF56]|jgi:uncharacterized protein YcnI/copper(I)-binding protein|uniref:DUF1775 domain-containing protein n=1 Tax=Rhizobium sp. RAF56 TaxID=3233062 RepID=UPI003F9BA870
MKTIKTLGFAALFCGAAVAGAEAHVTFLDDVAAPESTILATLQIPHGCDGKATTEVQVKLPEGFVFAKPQPKAGWEVEVIKGDYRKSYDNHGEAVKSGAVEIRWKGGNLSDDFYDTFVIRGKVSGVGAGTSLAFPVRQLCGDAVENWDQVAIDGDAHGLKSPAPVLKVAGDVAHDHMAGMKMDMNGMPGMDMSGSAAPAGDTSKVGDIAISGGFAKAMLPGQPVGGGYLTIHNGGSAADRLVSVTSAAAGKVELHEMTMENNVMKMRELKDGIAVAAGSTVTLAPNGLHLMFRQVKTPFKKGETVAITLTFEKAGTVDLMLPVLSAQGN